jgi:hypothetical protein
VALLGVARPKGAPRDDTVGFHGDRGAGEVRGVVGPPPAADGIVRLTAAPEVLLTAACHPVSTPLATFRRDPEVVSEIAHGEAPPATRGQLFSGRAVPV